MLPQPASFVIHLRPVDSGGGGAQTLAPSGSPGVGHTLHVLTTRVGPLQGELQGRMSEQCGVMSGNPITEPSGQVPSSRKHRAMPLGQKTTPPIPPSPLQCLPCAHGQVTSFIHSAFRRGGDGFTVCPLSQAALHSSELPSLQGIGHVGAGFGGVGLLYSEGRKGWLRHSGAL